MKSRWSRGGNPAAGRGRTVLPLLCLLGLLQVSPAGEPAGDWPVVSLEGPTYMLREQDVCEECLPQGHDGSHTFSVTLQHRPGDPRPGRVTLVFVRDGRPYAKTAGCTYRGSQPVEAGDRILVYARGYVMVWLTAGDAPHAQARLEHRTPRVPVRTVDRNGLRVRLEEPYRVWQSWQDPGGLKVLLDRYIATGTVDFQSRGRTVVRAYADAPLWPRAILLRSEQDAPVFRLEPLRTIQVAVEGGRPADVVVAYDCAKAPRDLPERTDGFIFWLFTDVPEVSARGGGVELRDVPGLPYHIYVLGADGGAGYCYFAPDDLAGHVDLARGLTLESAPRIAGAAPRPGTRLLSGRLDLMAILVVLATRAAESLSVEVPVRDWRGVRLPAAATVTAWHPATGITYLREGAGGVWEGEPEPGGVRLTVSRRDLRPGTLRVIPVLPGTGLIKVSGEDGVDHEVAEETTEVRGLPFGHYRLEYRPLATKRAVVAIVRIEAGSPEAQLEVGGEG